MYRYVFSLLLSLVSCQSAIACCGDHDKVHEARIVVPILEGDVASPSLANLSLIPRTSELLKPFPNGGDLNQALSEFAPRLVAVLDEHAKVERELATLMFARRGKALTFGELGYKLRINQGNLASAGGMIAIEQPTRQDLLGELSRYITNWQSFRRLWNFQIDMYSKTLYLQLFRELVPHLNIVLPAIKMGAKEEVLSIATQTSLENFRDCYEGVLAKCLGDQRQLINSFLTNDADNSESKESYVFVSGDLKSNDINCNLLESYLILQNLFIMKAIAVSTTAFFDETLEKRRYTNNSDPNFPSFNILIQTYRAYKAEIEARCHSNTAQAEERVRLLEENRTALKNKLSNLLDFKKRLEEAQAASDKKRKELQSLEKSRTTESKELEGLVQTGKTLAKALAEATKELASMQSNQGARPAAAIDLRDLELQQEKLLAQLKECDEAKGRLQNELGLMQTALKKQEQDCHQQQTHEQLQLQAVREDCERLEATCERLRQETTSAREQIKATDELHLRQLGNESRAYKQARDGNRTKLEALRAKIQVAKREKYDAKSLLENADVQTSLLKLRLQTLLEANQEEQEKLIHIGEECSAKAAAVEIGQQKLDSLALMMSSVAHSSEQSETLALETEAAAAAVESEVDAIYRDPAHNLQGEFQMKYGDGQAYPLRPGQIMAIAKEIVGQLSLQEFTSLVRSGQME
jgi:hypothetical protein